jgi:hypothetical protein
MIPNIDRDGNLAKEEAETVKNGLKWYSRQLTSNEFKNFITEAMNSKENRKAYIGIVTHEARQRIKDVSGKIMSNIILKAI